MDPASLPVTRLKGVGPRLAEKLARLGLATVQDVLFHLPLRYQDRTRLTPLGALRPGMETLVAGTIELADVAYRGRRSLVVRIADGTGHLHLRFFHFTAAQRDGLVRGRRLRCYGEVRFGPAGLEMAHPEYSLLREDEAPLPEQHLTPVYPATAGVGQTLLRRMVNDALEHYLRRVEEWLPESLLAELALPALQDALALVHRPPPGEDTDALLTGRHPAQQRLAFEELLAYYLSLKRVRERVRAERAPRIPASTRLVTKLLAGLSFQLTKAQQRVLGEIVHDLHEPHPMQRLVQGDVGSGKTVVAACAAAAAVEAGFQVAVMAPTELLAEQHGRNFAGWLAPLGIDVAALSGRIANSARAAALDAIASGRAAVVIGTHALFQEEVRFGHLGLVVVDEQHRFGVGQRLALRAKGERDGERPHQLIMSATPIPRTLAQSLYADLDVSVIDELPPGRQPVDTVAVPATRRAEVVARVRAACAAGRQAYWVCPLIEESEALDLETAVRTAETLKEALSEITIALVHGRVKPREKERVMTAFARGEIQLLVATTVIEVGVDVPNASLMIIENAERLGLSQLHQLRGRVGRGSAQSACVLLYQPPLSELARARLAALRETSDGFEIARRDLEMRGPGELLGTRQTGEAAFHIADIVRDRALLPRVQRAAERLLADHPDAVAAVIRRWMGGREEYGAV
ncbi:ATP-dependent DNA helicase RecG [Sulfurifustis variabilis]|uniref:ATP-dependent DNA helicase RecG n=1 Tax=Sulfurifustis variabilis TaxID=1675686 RepID=A0A1B4UZU8_9GAMM|nr:ATP-dependent DNA helicase RecG [Sulfurifustis variabilis]BAU46679.1 ATP-dependent DNA helicase RecG [Sulfurifustis variabilis]